MELIDAMHKACNALVESDGKNAQADIIARGIIDHDISPTGEILAYLTPADESQITKLYMQAEMTCRNREDARANEIALGLAYHVFDLKAWLAPSAIKELFDGKEADGWENEAAQLAA